MTVRVWQQGRGAGRGGAGPRGPGDRRGGRGLQRLHHPPAQPGDHRPTRPTTRGPGTARQCPVRRLHQGLQPRATSARTDRRRSFMVEDNQGNEFQPIELPENNAFAYQRARRCGKEMHPRGRQRGPAGPDRRLDAAVRVPAREHREPPAGAGHRAAPTSRRSASSSTSSGLARRAATSRARGPARSARPARPSRRPRRCARTAPPPRSSASCAGAKAVNQASVFDGSAACSSALGPRVSPSSAVPVLPATGHARDLGRRAGAVAHHADHQAPRRVGDPPGGHALARRARRRASAWAAPARRRWPRSGPPTPSAAAWPAPCPARWRSSPRSSGDLISPAAGMVLCCAPASDGGLFQPKRSAIDQPLGADLDAERREHRVARVGEALGEGAAARLAVGVLEVYAVDHGRGLDREPVAELDLFVLQRGRGGHDLERGARRLGRREGDAGQRADLARCGRRAPRCRRAGRPARSTAASCRRRVDRRPHRRRRARRERASTRGPASSVPPGNPSTCVWSARSSPELPDRRVAREAAGEEAAPHSAVVAGRHGARDRGADARGRRRGSGPGPRPAPCRPRDRIRARSGGSARRVSRSPPRRPGNTSSGAQSTPPRSTASCHLAAHARRRSACPP